MICTQKNNPSPCGEGTPLGSLKRWLVFSFGTSYVNNRHGQSMRQCIFLFIRAASRHRVCRRTVGRQRHLHLLHILLQSWTHTLFKTWHRLHLNVDVQRNTAIAVFLLGRDRRPNIMNRSIKRLLECSMWWIVHAAASRMERAGEEGRYAALGRRGCWCCHRFLWCCWQMSGETEGRKNSAEGFPTAARDPPNCDTAEFELPTTIPSSGSALRYIFCVFLETWIQKREYNPNVETISCRKEETGMVLIP